ncbi:stearoyl-CoA desaturase 5-like [Agrilus planipennis]|uniref:Stearoyl-CoA desaturase 5-like n=1 Tax=Agrilus planipennis TaxID=224129 RepID=A0A1W4WVL1_AGRPL|nr:stearoyl-CoA desaturase 5-like [Agrilus planipennis]
MMTRPYASSVTVQTLEVLTETNNKNTKKFISTCKESEEKQNDIRKKFEFDYSKYYFGSQLRWSNITFLIILHILAIHGLLNYEYLKSKHHVYLVLWSYWTGFMGGVGVTAGAHRLWCHRAYKAKLPLRIFLMGLYCMAGQNTLYEWVRDHRIHHKFSETNADPHNSKRGFFFSHIGWLMIKKHPEVIEKGRQLDLSDLEADPVVRFQQRYFTVLKLMLCFVLPILVPLYFWNVSWYWAVSSQAFVRYTISLHATFLVNSAAHMWGNRPYDKRIRPVENLTVAIWSAGEGWHNYHHTFPWDYRASEMGKYNPTTFVLDIFAKLGLAYDMKAPSQTLVKQIADKHGDGSWGDQEISEKDAAALLKQT